VNVITENVGLKLIRISSVVGIVGSFIGLHRMINEYLIFIILVLVVGMIYGYRRKNPDPKKDTL